MKQRVYLTLMVCALGSESLAQGPESLLDETGTRLGIQAQHDLAADFDAALKTRDSGGLEQFYAENAVRLPPGGEPLRGSAAIRSAFREHLSMYSIDHHLDVIEVHVSGDTAYSWGNWRSIDTPIGGSPMTNVGVWRTIRERQPDGSWKTILEIWNRKD